VAIQVAAVLIVAGGILLALFIDPSPLRTPAFAVAATILAIATVFAFLIGRTESALLYAVPVLDMLALIVMRQVPDDHIHAIGYLAILPALWLGWSGRLPLAALAVILSFGMIELPGITDDAALDLELALRDFLTPSVVLVAAGSTYVASRRTEASIASLVAQERTTAVALEREKRTSQLLDAILDAVDVGILAYDADGKEIVSNRTVQLHPVIVSTGLTPREIEEQGYLLETDRVTPIPPEEGFVTRARRGEEFRNRTVWVSAPGTQQHALNASATPLLGADGSFAGTVVAVEDVTTYLETLAAKDALVSSISHELRTPLASMVGYLELLLDDPDVPEHMRGSLEVIERNTDRLESLVSGLLSDARKERHAVTLERDLCDLAELCREVVDRSAAAAQAAGVRLSIDAPEPVMAIVDRGRISQAVNNLISNALRFSPEGGTASVAVRGDGDRVRMVIRDSGPGVPPDEMEALASPYYRPTATGEKFPGVGLGLTVTKHLIEAHLGTMEFSTTPGPGITVTVTLPVR
jgi:signal transduction histidine kinase